VTKFAVITVDASIRTPAQSGSSEAVPGTLSVLGDTSGALVDRENYETAHLFEQSIKLWKFRLRGAGNKSTLDVYRVNLNFSDLGDAKLTAACNEIGNGLILTKTGSEVIRDGGVAALRNNSEFKRLCRDLTNADTSPLPERFDSKGPLGDVPLTEQH